MNIFMNGLKAQQNKTFTENGATAYKTTGSALVDMFGTIGAMRQRADSEIIAKFIKAYDEDPLLAVKMIFYTRNIRGGLGERQIFRTLLKFIAMEYPAIVIKNLENIPKFGRYDDLYTLVETPVEALMWQVIKQQFEADMASTEQISLLAKWLKSANTSSDHSRKLGRMTAQQLGLTERAYRQALSKLRSQLNVVEKNMSQNKWEVIAYAQVPSLAMSNYRNAFKKHDLVRYDNYLNMLVRGETTVNASTLYPYDILERMSTGGFYLAKNLKHDVLLEQQWKALPNYVQGENNVLVMADTSGSMTGRPMATSVGLAIYFAERNQGAFKNMFLTFSATPALVELKGNSLYGKIALIPEIVANTDLEKAFDLVLAAAKTSKCKSKDMPKAIIVISDMEFDQQTTENTRSWSFYENMVEKYKSCGYIMPNVVFWNVNSRRDVFQTATTRKGVQYASGQSVSTFKTIIENIGKTPFEAVIQCLSDPHYDTVII